MTLRHPGLPDPVRKPEFYAAIRRKRLAAWALDTVQVGLACTLLLPFTAFTGILFFPLMMITVGFVYRWTTIASGSATRGMRLVALELRGADGRRLRPESAFQHTLGYTLSFLFPVAQVVSVVMMLVSRRKQGLTDQVLGTAAINRPAPGS